ncbi:MAG: DUF2339 domain-containing protein [Pirellulales bacterium]|nr:DUF2339 domain-containing protein [Pirellulales bacterium]
MALILFVLVALLCVILGVLISVKGRQESDYQDLSRRLDRVEWNAQRALGLLREREKAPTEEPAIARPPAESTGATPAPRVEEPIEAEVVEPEKPAEPIGETPVPPPLPPPLTPLPPHVPTEIKPAAYASQSTVEPSQFESAAKETLRKIGRWILVGEDELPEGVSIEYAVARNWLVRVGILIGVVGVALFLMHSIKEGWIDEVGQVMLSAAAGLVMLVAGTRMLGRRYHLLGQGLIGGGIAVLYLTVYAAHSYYKLPWMPHPTAFALMIGITCLAGGIAVRFNTLLVAVLGILGGYATPVMLETHTVAYVALYSYLLILGTGVLGISYKKNWRLLNYLSFAGTYLLLFATMRRWNYCPENFWQVMPFLIAFFVLFSTMNFLFNFVNRNKTSLLEVLALIVNAGIFYGLSNCMIRNAYDSRWVAAVTLSLSAFYAAHVYFFLICRMLDRELLLSFIGLSAFFLAVTMPVLLSEQWVTASWAVQALVMFWMAGKLRSEFLRNVAYLLYAIVLFRFGIIDLRQQYFSDSFKDLETGRYLWLMVERLVTFGVPIASLAGAGWLMQRSPPKALLPVGEGNDVSWRFGARDAVVAITAAVAGMIFLALHLELNQSVAYFYEPLRLPMLSLLWVAMCAFLLLEYRAYRNNALLALLVCFAAGMVIKLFAFDLPAWHIGGNWRYGGEFYSFRDGGLRLLDFGAMIALMVFAWNLLRRLTVSPTDEAGVKFTSNLFGSAALAMLFVFLTLEANTFLDNMLPELRVGGVSILWACFALGLVVGGMWKDVRAIRYAGLALFAVVAYKILFLDLAREESLYRALACVLVGALVLCGGFVYIKCRPLVAARNKEGEQ